MMSNSRRDRREENHQRTGVAIGIAGALIASLLVYQVFLRSDDTAAPTAATGAASGVSIDGRVAAAGSTTTTVPLEPTLANGSFDELSLRDPFEPPIRNTPSGTTTPTTRATPTTTSSSTFSTTPTTSPQQNPAPTTDVALLDVYSDNGVQTARIRVGGTEYTAVAGGTFAVNYKLVSFASEKCVNLTYADSPFSLCQGEQVTK